MYCVQCYYLGNTVIISAVPSIIIAEDKRQLQTSQVIVMPISKQPCFTYDNSTVKILRQQRKCLSKGGFQLSRNFYVRTDVNFNWLYVRKLKER